MIFTKSLKKNRDFKQVYSAGRPAVNGVLRLYARPNGMDQNRLGLSVGKKTGNAVKRNKVKRLIREAYKIVEPSLKQGYDIVVAANFTVNTGTGVGVSKKIEFALIKKALDELLAKKGLTAEHI